MASNDVDWELQSIQLMERDWTGRMFDRPCSDAESDAHSVGYFFANRNVVAHEPSTRAEIAMPNKLHTPAMDKQVKAAGKRTNGLQSSLVDSWPRFGVDWWLAPSDARKH